MRKSEIAALVLEDFRALLESRVTEGGLEINDNTVNKEFNLYKRELNTVRREEILARLDALNEATVAFYCAGNSISNSKLEVKRILSEDDIDLVAQLEVNNIDVQKTLDDDEVVKTGRTAKKKAARQFFKGKNKADFEALTNEEVRMALWHAKNLIREE